MCKRGSEVLDDGYGDGVISLFQIPFCSAASLYMSMTYSLTKFHPCSVFQKKSDTYMYMHV